MFKLGYTHASWQNHGSFLSSFIKAKACNACKSYFFGLVAKRSVTMLDIGFQEVCLITIY